MEVNCTVPLFGITFIRSNQRPTLYVIYLRKRLIFSVLL